MTTVASASQGRLGWGAWRLDRLVPVVCVIACPLVAWAVFFTGQPQVVVALVLAVLAIALILNRPIVGLYLVFAGVVLVEQYSFNPRLVPITSLIPLYTYVLGPAVPIAPLDMILVLTMLGLAIEWLRRVRGRDPYPSMWRGNAVLPALGLLALLLFASEMWGLKRSSCQYYSAVGGIDENCNFDLWVTNWEIRSFVYMIITTLLSFRLVNTTARVKAIVAILLVGTGVKSLQAIHNYWVGNRGGFGPEEMRALTAHEDAILFALVILLSVAAIAFQAGRTSGMMRIAVAMTPLAVAGFVVANRRIAYGAISLAAAALLASLPRTARRRVVLLSIPVAVLSILYLPAFWDRPGTVAARPAQAVRAIVDPSGIDKSSNEYREIENYNLLVSIRRHLTFGTGFGHRYEQPFPLPKLPNPLQPYIPHNEVLWFWLKTGSIGMVVLWTWFGIVYISASRTMRSALNEWRRLLCALALAIVPLQIMASWGDLQLTFFRNMIWVGVLTGAAGRAALDTRAADSSIAVPAPSGAISPRAQREVNPCPR